jgi:hypothetical protein
MVRLISAALLVVLAAPVLLAEGGHIGGGHGR